MAVETLPFLLFGMLFRLLPSLAVIVRLFYACNEVSIDSVFYIERKMVW
ncbi:hypothetical protein Hanom_Chr00s000003g01605531 [Helianthus anomalus]